MIYVHKNKTPEFLVEFVKKHPRGNYTDNSFKRYHYDLRDELIREQKGLCAYCCSRITLENSHNEHIEPRHMKDGSLSNKSLDYNNIVALRNSSDSCGNYKGNSYDENRFVSPLSVECDKIFSYDPDGYIKGDDYTIELLNLNSYRLRRARSAVYKTIFEMESEDIRQSFCLDSEKYYPYSNVIFWYLDCIENNSL